MGCSSARKVACPEETQIQALSSNQQVLQPPTYQVLQIAPVNYGVLLYKMTLEAKLFLSQSLVVTIQWQQRQIQVIATVTQSNATQLSFYVYYPSFDFSNFVVAQVEQFESRLEVHSKNVCFIGHGPGASVVRNLANKYSVEYNYYVLSALTGAALEKIPQAIYCDLSQKQHPIYELMRIKQSVSQVVVCGPAWLLREVRCFCVKHGLQGYGLFMLYGQYSKQYPVKWLDLNADNVVDEIRDFDPLERAYAEENYQAFLQRIQYATNCKQLEDDEEIDDAFSDSQHARTTPFYDPSKNVLSDQQEAKSRAFQKVSAIEAEWLQTDVIRGKQQENASGSFADKKPQSQHTARLDSRSKSDFAGKRPEMSQPDGRRKIVSAAGAEIGWKHARSQYEESSSAFLRPLSAQKSTKMLPKYQSSFVGALDVDPPEEDQNDTLDKPQVEIQRQETQNSQDNSRLEQNELSDIQVQHQRVNSAKMDDFKKNGKAQPQQSKKESKQRKRQGRESATPQRETLAQQPLQKPDVQLSVAPQSSAIAPHEESDKTDIMSPDEIQRQLSGINLRQLDTERNVEELENRLQSAELAEHSKQDKSASSCNQVSSQMHYQDIKSSQAAKEPSRAASPLKQPLFAQQPSAKVSAPQSRNDSMSGRDIVKLTQLSEDPKTENVQQQVLEVLRMQEDAKAQEGGSQAERDKNGAARTMPSRMASKAKLDLIAESENEEQFPRVPNENALPPKGNDPVSQEAQEDNNASPGSIRLKIGDGPSLDNESVFSAHNALQSSMLMNPDQPDAVGSNLIKMGQLRSKQLDISVIPKKGQ